MRKSISMVVLLLIVVLGTFGAVSAQGPDGDKSQALWCSDMLEAQVSGGKPGSACSVPMVPVGMSFDAISQSLRTLYRRGRTNRWTSESDSDLVEDVIKVEGFFYWWVSGGWQLDDDCEDENTWSSHAACRTYGGGGGASNKQTGYHYFHKAGYYDHSFWTSDYW